MMNFDQIGDMLSEHPDIILDLTIKNQDKLVSFAAGHPDLVA